MFFDSQCDQVDRYLRSIFQCPEMERKVRLFLLSIEMVLYHLHEFNKHRVSQEI
jgi:hypothetical protein